MITLRRKRRLLTNQSLPRKCIYYLENFFGIQLALRTTLNGMLSQFLLVVGPGLPDSLLFLRLSGSVILGISCAYDVRPGDKNNRIVEAAEFTNQLFLQLSVPGRTLIDIIPALKYIPPWVPGAYTQRLGAKSKRMVLRYKAELFGHVEKDMVV
jgi:hypothetical protein